MPYLPLVAPSRAAAFANLLRSHLSVVTCHFDQCFISISRASAHFFLYLKFVCLFVCLFLVSHASLFVSCISCKFVCFLYLKFVSSSFCLGTRPACTHARHMPYTHTHIHTHTCYTRRPRQSGLIWTWRRNCC
jgi:hypothetical protein